MRKREKNGDPLYSLLVYLVLCVLNLAIIFAVQACFIHIYDRPITKESLAEIPYFSGCEILDMSGEEDSTGPGYVLFKAPDGQLKVVELDYNLYLPRFAIDKDSVQTVPNVGVQIAHFNRISGKTQITVKNEEIIQHSSQLDDGGADRWDYIYMAIGLLLLEGAVMLLIDKLRKKA